MQGASGVMELIVKFATCFPSMVVISAGCRSALRMLPRVELLTSGAVGAVVVCTACGSTCVPKIYFWGHTWQLVVALVEIRGAQRPPGQDEDPGGN